MNHKYEQPLVLLRPAIAVISQRCLYFHFCALYDVERDVGCVKQTLLEVYAFKSY